MNNQRLKGMKIAILATDGFEQSELLEPKKALEQAGGKTVIISPNSGQIQGYNHHDKGEVVTVDSTLDQVKPGDFDAVLLPGGALNADALRMIPQAQAFVQKIEEADKPIAVICHAPWLLVSSDLVNGRTLTSYYTLQDDIRNAGGRWLDQEVVRDRNWVSSRSPKDIPTFNPAIVELFSQCMAERQHSVPVAGD